MIAVVLAVAGAISTLGGAANWIVKLVQVLKAPNAEQDKRLEEIEKHGLELLGVLPQDEGVYRCDCAGEPSAKLPGTNPVKAAVCKIMASLGI